MLALHCLLASGSAWRGLRGELDFELICPDLPGHGRGPAVEADFMGQAARLALAAAPDGAFDVIGHSFGACVALRLMADYPDRVRRAILVEPVMFAAAGAQARADYVAASAPYAEAMARGDAEGALAAFHGQWGDGAVSSLPAPARHYMKERIGLVAASAPAIVEDEAGVLGRLPDRPVTLISGSRAAPVMTAILAGLADLLPRSDVAVVPGAGHMIPLTHPKPLAKIVEATLGQAGSRPA